MFKPEDIVLDEESGLQMAHFDYYTGIKFAKERGLKQSCSMSEVADGTHFIVCCGSVMVKVDEDYLPDFPRRII